MVNETYNGWTNRATWLVNVWGNPESKDDVQMLRDMLEDQYNELPNGILKDMIDLDEINWDELMEHFNDEEEEESEEDQPMFANILLGVFLLWLSAWGLCVGIIGACFISKKLKG